MNKKITILIAFVVLFFVPLFSTEASAQEPTFRIMTKSDFGDYIGQNKTWDFSNSNNSKIYVNSASQNQVVFKTENFDIDYMMYEFAAETGKNLSPGLLYTPAKRFAFRDSFNGIDIGGDGRGCNRILGAFYVHEYVIATGTLAKAAIDFVQICEPQSSDINEQSPKLYGSLRYNSSMPDSCNSQGCAEAKNNLGIVDKLVVDGVNDHRVTNSNSLAINWNTNLEATCMVAHGENQNVTTSQLGSIVQRPTPTNDGKYWYTLKLDNLKDAPYYYQINCSAGGQTANLPTTATQKMVSPKPDLVITGVEQKNVSPQTIFGKDYDVVNFLVHYKNNSLVDINNNFYISMKSGITPEYQNGFKSSNPVNSIYPVAKANTEYDYEIGGYLLPRGGSLKTNFTFGIDRDYFENYDNLISESNENNNTLVKTVSFSQEQVGNPDLIIKSIVENTINNSITIVIKNIGTGNADIKNSIVKVIHGSNYYDKIKNCKPDDFVCLTWEGKRVDEYNAGINAGAYGKNILASGEEYSILFNKPNYLLQDIDFKLGATYLIKSYVDFNNGTNESNENNNTLEKTVTVSKIEQPSNQVKVISPIGGEEFEQGINFKINWKDGKELVQIGLVGKNAVSTYSGFNADGILGWIKLDGRPDGEFIWEGKNICSLDGTICQTVSPGTYKILAVSKSVNGNLIFGNDGPNGDIANWSLSNAFTIVSPRSGKDNQIDNINNQAKSLNDGKISELLKQIKQLRDELREQAAELKYLKIFAIQMRELSSNMQSAIKAFIAYGVDENTKKLGEGERAAVVSSYEAAFDKLPQTEAELADAIKIANGRFPGVTSDIAEKRAKEQFYKIYKRVADMNDNKDAAAVKVMAYGLRQSANNRNLSSEKTGIKTFTHIFGKGPKTTEDWNAMQAITYSGATKKIDTDKDGLADETEKKLGTDMNKVDSDGDGYKDGEEVLNGYSPKGAGKF